MSQLDSRSTRPAGILIRRPKTTVYTVLIGVALAAIIIACLLLILELNRYDYVWRLPWKVHL